MTTAASTDERLIPLRSGMEMVGIRSATTAYKLIDSGELPEPVYRGRNAFFLLSELQAHIARLAEKRRAAAAHPHRGSA